MPDYTHAATYDCARHAIEAVRRTVPERGNPYLRPNRRRPLLHRCQTVEGDDLVVTWDETARGADARSDVSERVVEAVARKAGVDHTDLDPLYGTIDPDALDALFADSQGHTEHGSVRITFEYAGYPVTVSDAGSVTVGDPGEEAVTQRSAVSPAPDRDHQATD